MIRTFGRVVPAAIGIATVLLAAGCSKSSADKAGPSGKPSDTAGCAAGAYRDPGGVYCVVVPKGLTQRPTDRAQDRAVEFWILDESTSLRIEISTASTSTMSFENLKQIWDKDHDDVKLLGSADLPGGGIYQKFDRPADRLVTNRAIIKVGDKIVQCFGQRPNAQPANPDDACKTLRGSVGTAGQ